MILENIQEFKNHVIKGRPLIGLDIGTVRIGIALSDIQHIIASPHSIYERRNMRQDLGHIGALAASENACAFIVGLPLGLDGQEGENCEIIRSFCNKLYKKTTLPVFLKDERMSTAAANRALLDAGVKRKERHSLDDKIAASYILQSVIDMLG